MVDDARRLLQRLVEYALGDGTDGGTGYCVEYTGDAIRRLSMEERMTVCNMTIEAGARFDFRIPRGRQRLKLELVNVAQVWYVVELTCG